MQQIGRYQVIRELGRGAMGVVYEAHDPLIGRTVAVKTIRLDSLGNPSEAEQLQERLFREAHSAGALSHPGIVVIHDLGRHEATAYIAMERVDGPTLEQFLAEKGRPAPAEAINILRQTAVALDHAHENGVVHRDIKPGNLMLHKGSAWKITDFGIAKITTTQQLTQTGMVLGTPSYMSPEHISAQPVDGRTDQFSLAVIAFELLAGKKPFQAETLAGLVHQIVYLDRPSARSYNPELTEAADAVLKRGLAKEAGERYPSCSAFVDALENSVAPQAVPAKSLTAVNNFCKECGAGLAEGQAVCRICARSPGRDKRFEKAFGLAGRQPPVQPVSELSKSAPSPVLAPSEHFVAQSRRPQPTPPAAASTKPPASVGLNKPLPRRVVLQSLKGAAVGAVLTIVTVGSWLVFRWQRSSVGPAVEPGVRAEVVRPAEPAKAPGQKPAAAHPEEKAPSPRVPARSKTSAPARELSLTVNEQKPTPSSEASNVDTSEDVRKSYAAEDYWRVLALAERGNALAQNLAGIMYSSEQGVPKDEARAAAWFQKAADQGYAPAQNSLGVMYHDGRGVLKDYAQAIDWFRKAAKGGNAAAQNNLGYMYENGLGVPQDYEIANAFYGKAARQGIQQPKNRPSRLRVDQ